MKQTIRGQAMKEYGVLKGEETGHSTYCLPSVLFFRYNPVCLEDVMALPKEYERYSWDEYRAWPEVDPEEQVVEIYRHDGECFDRLGAYGPEDRLKVTALPGFELDLSETF